MIRPRLTIRILASIAVILTVVGFVVMVGEVDTPGIQPFFDLDAEGTIAAWFSSILLFAAGVLLAVIAHSRPAGEPTRAWWILSLGFVGLSADENIAFHERLGGVLEALGFEPDGAFFFAWVIPGAFVAIAVAIGSIGLLRRLPARHRWPMVMAGAIYVGGALAIEFVEGAVASTRGEENTLYRSLVTVQEFAEMLGIILFIWVLLKIIEETSGEIAIRVLDDR